MLSYEVESQKEFDEQVAYLRQKGVGVVVEDNWKGQKGRENETELLKREPGFVANGVKKLKERFHAGRT